MVPAGSSIAWRARHATGETRPGHRSPQERTTRPDRSTNITSMGNRIPKVWTWRQRLMTSPSPGARLSRAQEAAAALAGGLGEARARGQRGVSGDVQDGDGAAHVRSLRAQHGEPAAIVYGGMSRVTTEPAPTTAPSPMVTPLVTTTIAPSQQSFPMSDRAVLAVLRAHGAAQLHSVVRAVDVYERAEHGVVRLLRGRRRR